MLAYVEPQGQCLALSTCSMHVSYHHRHCLHTLPSECVFTNTTFGFPNLPRQGAWQAAVGINSGNREEDPFLQFPLLQIAGIALC